MTLRRHLTSVVLVVVAAMLAAFALWDRQAISTDEAAGRAGHLFEAWRPEELSAVSLTTPDSRVELERVSEGPGESSWFEISGQTRAAGDEQSVEDLLLTLEYATFDRRVEGVDSKTLGLEPPALVVTVAMGQLRYTLRLGGPAPTPLGARYAEVLGGSRGAKQYVVGKELVRELTEDPAALRNKRLVPYLLPEIERYELAGGSCADATSKATGEAGASAIDDKGDEKRRGATGIDDKGDAERKGASAIDDTGDAERKGAAEKAQKSAGNPCNFVLRRAGLGGRASSDLMLESSVTGSVRASWRVVDVFVTALSRIDAVRFVTAGDEGPSPRVIRLVPRDPSRPTAELRIGGDCDGGTGTLVRRVAPEPVLACVPNKLVEIASVAPSRFVDRHLVGAPSGEITELTLSSGGIVVELARRERGWYLRKPEDRQIDAELGNALLERMAATEGELVPEQDVDESKLDLATPRATVRIWALAEQAGAKERIEELAIFAEREGRVTVRRVADGRVVSVSADDASAFLPAPSALRGLTIFEGVGKQVRGLELDCDGKRQKLTADAAGAWTLLEPKVGLRADSATAGELARMVRELSAVRWEAEHAEPRHGLAQPRCRITLRVAKAGPDGNALETGGAEDLAESTLRLGADTSGGLFAQRDGDDAVFVVPRALFVAAGGWHLDRGALMLDGPNTERVRVERGGQTLELLRRGESWILSGGESGQDTRSKTLGMLLENLIAEGVVSLGPAEKAHGFEAPTATIVSKARAGGKAVELSIGVSDVWRDERVYYVRKRGLEATFAVGSRHIKPVLDAL
ncbi:MAG: DUF4340 domain-containing protein [Myxococcales bacterium]|nr:DUF4340 domain-containing protein [Myxococcales bacterium]